MQRIKKGEISSIFKIAWPAILQELLATVVTYVDTAMVGKLGAHFSAAVGLTGTVSWLVTSIPSALGIGVLSAIAQADGAKDEKTVKKAGQQAVFITLVIGALMTAICLAVSPYICTWLNGDAEILADATEYFRITMLPLIFRVAVIVFSGALRGVKDMKTPMLINLLMNFVNVFLNFFLIYDEITILGLTINCPGMGVRGAAVASAISFVAGGLAISLRFLFNKRFELLKTGIKYEKEIMKRCLEIGLPITLQRAVICFGHIVFASQTAKLGVIPFAAHSIALQAEQAFYIPGNGLQSAATTLAGNAVGERDEKKLRHTTLLICGITFSLMFIAGTILFIFAENLMGIFTNDAEVITLGASVLKIVAVSEPLYGVMIILEGVFNGIGDTKAPVLFAIITMWGIRITGTFIIVNLLHLGLQYVWLMMIADNIGRCALLLTRFIKREIAVD